MRPYRLTERGGSGIACDDKGVALGLAELTRLGWDEAGVIRCQARSPQEIGRILQAAYGPLTDSVASRLHRGLCRAAAWIEAGDLGRAGVEAVRLGLPELTPRAVAKLAEIADLQKDGAMAWETEPRIPAGQREGGQWTSEGGGGLPAATEPTGNAAARRPPSIPARSGSRGSRPTKAPAKLPAASERPTMQISADQHDRSLLMHLGATPAMVAPRAVMRDIPLPANATRLSRAGLLVLGAALLDQLGEASARQQIARTITRFGLDAGRPAEATAAGAYVWSQYALPWRTSAPFTGPELDAASQAVMRFALMNPDAFGEMLQSPQPEDARSYPAIMHAANAGLADYIVESRRRPCGVAPELQTTSESARAALQEMLQKGKLAVHHLVPAVTWGKYQAIAKLAQEAGWHQDNPSNLIALPRNMAEFEELGGRLPMHIGDHRIYTATTEAGIESSLRSFSTPLTPFKARAILENAALQNWIQIMRGAYHPVMKAEK